LDLQETSYGFGYGSLWSLAELILRTAELPPFASSSLIRTSASDIALVLIIHNISWGFIFAIKWLPWA
jgi:hypothetical protein